MKLPARVLALTFLVATLGLIAVWPAASGGGGPAPAGPDPPPSPARWSLWEYYLWDYTYYDNAYETASQCYWSGLATCGRTIHGWAEGFVDECNRLGRDRVWVQNTIIATAEEARAAWGPYGVVAHWTDPAHFYPTCGFGAYDVRTFF